MPRSKVKIASIFLIVMSVFFIVAGGATWVMVSQQLRAEEITIPDDARWFAGEEVRGPLTAFSQADIINTHALQGTEGRTYAELGALAGEAAAAGDDELAAELTEQRTSIMNASFLRSSLFSSVIAYGVSALVIGLGAVMLVVGLLMRPRKEVVAGPDHEGAHSADPNPGENPDAKADAEPARS